MRQLSFKIAVIGLILTSLMLIWLSLGVGIIGADGDPHNLIYGLVILAGIIGALSVKRDALGLASVAYSMAAVQLLIGVVAIILKWGMPYSPPVELAMLNGFFVVVFIACAQLFRFSAGRSNVTV